MYNSHMKRCSTLLGIKEMQFKTTIKYTSHLGCNKKDNNKYWWECEETVTHIHCWWEYKMAEPLWKTVLQFLKQLNVDSPHMPEISLLSIPERLIHKILCIQIDVFYVFQGQSRENTNSLEHTVVQKSRKYSEYREYTKGI